MREITEAQAQELANLTGLTICVDGYTWGFEKNTYYDNRLGWTDGSFLSYKVVFPIRIISSRPWTEQIWRPRG